MASAAVGFAGIASKRPRECRECGRDRPAGPTRTAPLYPAYASDDDRREISIAVTGHGRPALAEDIAVRGAWLARAMTEKLNASERARLLAAAAPLLKLARA